MQRGLIEKQEQRLLRKSASEDDAVLFSAGDFAHPAIAEMIGANLSQGVAGNDDVVFALETQRTPGGVAALQNKFPGSGRKQRRTLLLNQSEAFRAGARPQRMGADAA